MMSFRERDADNKIGVVHSLGIKHGIIETTLFVRHFFFVLEDNPKVKAGDNVEITSREGFSGLFVKFKKI